MSAQLSDIAHRRAVEDWRAARRGKPRRSMIRRGRDAWRRAWWTGYLVGVLTGVAGIVGAVAGGAATDAPAITARAAK